MTIPSEGVSWTDYGPHHMTVSIDCGLASPPFGNDYYDARQGVVEAIVRATNKSEVECFTGKEKQVRVILESLGGILILAVTSPMSLAKEKTHNMDELSVQRLR